MEKNEDFNEDEQPQEEFTDPLPEQGSIGPDEDIFGIPPPDEADYSGEDDIQYQRTIAELRKEDKLDAFSLQHTLKRLRMRKKHADRGKNQGLNMLDDYVTAAEQQCRITQQKAVQPEMQAEIEKRALNNGIRGYINKLRRAFGRKIKIPKNIDIEDVYRAVVEQIKESRQSRVAEIQARQDMHEAEIEGQDGYVAKMREYQTLVQDGLDAIQVAEARTRQIETELKNLRVEKDTLAKKVASKPHDASSQQKYRDIRTRIAQYEEEKHTLSFEIDEAYSDMEDNDAKCDHYAALVSQDRGLQRLSKAGLRGAQRDVDDLVMQEESGGTLGRVGDTVRVLAKSTAESGKVDAVVSPQTKAAEKIFAKVNESLEMGILANERRRTASSSSIDEANIVTNLSRRDMYKQMRIKYG